MNAATRPGHPYTAQVTGHICLDLMPDLLQTVDLRPGALNEVGPLAMQPGGSVANTGLVLRQLGIEALLSGDIGDDPIGMILQETLTVAAVDMTLSVRSGHTTSYSVVVEAPRKDRVFFHHVGANAMFDGASIEPAAADLIHIGYPPLLPSLTDHHGEALLALLRRARAADVTTSVDMAVVDRSSAAGRVSWPELLEDALPLIDVFSASVDDVSSALGLDVTEHSSTATARFAQRFVSLGAGVALVTDGPHGMALATSDRTRLDNSQVTRAISSQWEGVTLHHAAVPVRNPRTTGAGDAATAGLLDALLRGMSAHDAIRRAAHVAAARLNGNSDYRGAAESALDRVGDPALRSHAQVSI